MAINPFAQKPQVNHAKLIKDFVTSYKDIRQDETEMRKEFEDFQKEVMDSKKDMQEVMEDLKKNIHKNPKDIMQMKTYCGYLREKYSAWKEDLESDKNESEKIIQGVEKSKDKMSKEEGKKITKLQELQGTFNKYLRRLEGVLGEIVFIEKRIKIVEDDAVQKPQEVQQVPQTVVEEKK